MSVPAAEVIFVRDRSLLEAAMGNELVGLDVQDGLCFGFNDAATSIWRLLDQPMRFGDLIDRLVDEYQVDRATCEQDTAELLDRLVAQRLLRRG